ncbi:hypothetical protein [Erwinia sp. E_sp_B04_7]|uniref:hypothetical protein n=1 Tax=unclassified Erwinia TaxID=2622719 RepID=UPI0030CEC978
MVRNGKHSVEGNLDPKEPMLCHDCEQYLCNTFEKYGIDVLRNRKEVRKNSDHIIIRSFNYEKYYLYLLSILWRASIAEHLHYRNVVGERNLDDALRHCILKNSLRFNKLIRLRIDHFIKICLFRIVDKTNTFNDELIRAILSNFSQTNEESIDGIIWHFIADGFLIIYAFAPGKDVYDMMTKRFNSQLVKGSHQKVMKMEIMDNQILLSAFGNLVKAVDDKIKSQC